MNSKFKLALIILAAVVVIILAIVIISALTGGSEEGGDVSAPPVETSSTQTPDALQSTPPEETPAESSTGANTTTATIAVGGDIVMHSGLNTEALQSDGTYDYTPIFGVLPELVSGADYAVCSLATTLVESGSAYMAYPLFRSPTSVADAVASVGFDLVNTATSHLADAWKDGIDYTLNTLEGAGLSHVGTYRTQDERTSSGNRTMVDVNGISVAFLAYTCDTNNVPVSGFEYAASICATDYLTGGTSIDYELMDADISAAREAGADLVFVFMSWGTEFSTEPSELQYEIADNLISSGADVIIGGHCRVPQPMEMRTVQRDDGTERSGFVCYSLGNLISCQNDEYTDISAILNLTITRDNDTGVTRVTDVSYRPIYMADLYDYGINDYDWHYRVVDLHAAIDAWESGDNWEWITQDIYNDMAAALDDAHALFGGEYDPEYTPEQ